MIENAAKGENWMFRNFYVEDSGEIKDILNDGRWSCAVFVSSVLYFFNSVLEFERGSKWIDFIHANVLTAEKDMQKNGWYRIKDLKLGAVIIWENKLASEDNTKHGHIGFYVGGDMAISNNSKETGFPWKHHYTYNGARKIEKIYWHSELED